MDKRLFECTVTLVYYAYAEDEGEARVYARDASRDSLGPEDVYVRHVREPVLSPIGGWDRNCPLYHAGREEITLGDALDERDGWRNP